MRFVGGCEAPAGLAAGEGDEWSRKDLQQAIHFSSACATGAGEEERPGIRGATDQQEREILVGSAVRSPCTGSIFPIW